MSSILFVGGGSAGHIAPSVAIWRTLHAKYPTVHGHFVCSPRTADRLFLEGEHLSYTTISSPRIGWAFPFLFWKSLLDAFVILHTQKPQLIFSKGGYVSLPICIAAWTQGIPIILHESDVLPGRANRLIARFAKHICHGFTQTTTSKRIPMSFTGNPIRPEITRGSKEEGLRLTGFSGQRPVLLVWGGSQGAKKINDAVIHLLPQLTKSCDVIHITGAGKKDAIHREGYWSIEFATQELPHLFAITDLAISRAAASSIAELAANAIPTILVPLRGLAQDHQLRNAEIAEKSGGCILLHQENLEQKLGSLVNSLLQNADRLKEMRTSIQKLSTPDASGRVCEIIFKYIEKPISSH